MTDSTVATAYFGDGATSEGAFHEGANLAAVMQAPLILFCNNNQWAISTPLEAQTHAETLADKAVGYGMPGVRVDGGDVLAVYEATREAVELARAGETVVRVGLADPVRPVPGGAVIRVGTVHQAGEGLLAPRRRRPVLHLLDEVARACGAGPAAPRELPVPPGGVPRRAHPV